MKSFFMEYGLVIITFIAVMFCFWYIVWLPSAYKEFELNLMSTMTGVEVDTILEAQKYVAES